LEIPNMIIQPFIENSIWHGIMPVPYKGFINLSIQPSNNETLLITITDNGIGFNDQKKLDPHHESKGISIIRDRLMLLDPGVDDPLVIQSLNPGTIVKIKLSSKTYNNLYTKSALAVD